jgi:hypothetical protein
MRTPFRRDPRIIEACEKLGTQVKLDGHMRKYWEIRWLHETTYMWHRVDDNRTRFYTFRTISGIASVLVPSLIGLNLVGNSGTTVRWITFALSVFAGISAAMSGLFRSGDRWTMNRRYLNPLYTEGVQYATLSAKYAAHTSHVDAFQEFSDAIEDILARYDVEYEQHFLSTFPDELLSGELHNNSKPDIKSKDAD